VLACNLHVRAWPGKRHTYVKRINATRVQPVSRVNVVTRVHNRTVVLHQTQHLARTASTRTMTTGKIIRINRPTQHPTCNC
jgi:phage-related protein